MADLIATPGAEDADSYGTLAESDAYFDALGNTDWVDADEDLKNGWMRKGATYIDGHYLGDFKGRKTSSSQALAFPRKHLTDEDGNRINDDVIPKKLKYAQFEAADRERQSPGSLSPDIERVTKREQVGPLSVEYDGGSEARTKFTAVADLLKPFLTGGSSGGVTFLLRA